MNKSTNDDCVSALSKNSMLKIYVTEVDGIAKPV